MELGVPEELCLLSALTKVVFPVLGLGFPPVLDTEVFPLLELGGLWRSTVVEGFVDLEDLRKLFVLE